MRSFYVINKKNDYNKKIDNVEIVECTEIDVAKIILNQFSCEGDYILDPFMGLGTIISIANELKENVMASRLIQVDIIMYVIVLKPPKP